MRTTVLVAFAFALSTSPPAAAPAGFIVTSPGLADGATVPTAMVFSGQGCTGGNISPELDWKGAPAGAESFAVTMHDPDAPRAGGFWHWVVFDIPAKATGLAEGAGDPARELLPAAAVAGRNDFGIEAYGGPCPPVGGGIHHYEIVVHALKVGKLPVAAGDAPAKTASAIRAAELGEASLMLVFGR
jgi:Raf kinase inhibitor-like YbhB/YbcL family protein